MLSQVKKLMDPTARAEIGARFGAWWDGRDYVPGAEGDEPGAETHSNAPVADAADHAAEPSAQAEKPRTTGSSAGHAIKGAGLTPRLKALETLWGEGAFGPASTDLQDHLFDAVFEGDLTAGDIGFIGADPALITACRARTGGGLFASEWRSGCVDRIEALAPDVTVSFSDLDRSKSLGAGPLRALVSVDAFAYADHKAGLVARAYRMIADKGRWVFLETVKHTKKAPSEAFASAWAEPQLTTEIDIEETLDLAGFAVLERVDVTQQVLEAAHAAFAQLPGLLDQTAGAEGRDGALFLRELSWEIQSWRARMRALEGGALQVFMWVVEKGHDAGAEPAAKTEAPGLTAEMSAPEVDTPVQAEPEELEADAEDDDAGPLDQGAIDSLFD
ncbi:MAG: hypothetical protein R3C52_02850 [Hyphomonadaceae bacterium]